MKFIQLYEGAYVIKNKDGKEKRFKDSNSSEAKAWKDSSTLKRSPLPKAERFSADWWIDKEGDRPWDRIEDGEDVNKILKKEMGKEPGDWTFGRHYMKMVDGVNVAGRIVKATFVYGPNDDMGVEQEVENTENYGVIRDVKNPKKLIFDGWK